MDKKPYWEIPHSDEAFRAGYQARLDNGAMSSGFDPWCPETIRDEYDKGYQAANQDMYLEDGAFVDTTEELGLMNETLVARPLELVQWLF